MEFTTDQRDFLVSELLDAVSDGERSPDERELARSILSEMELSSDDLPSADDSSVSSFSVFTVKIDRESNSGNLIPRRSSSMHVNWTAQDGKSPAPAELWLVRVPENGSKQSLEPLVFVKTLEDYVPKSPSNRPKGSVDGLNDPHNLNKLIK